MSYRVTLLTNQSIMLPNTPNREPDATFGTLVMK